MVYYFNRRIFIVWKRYIALFQYKGHSVKYMDSGYEDEKVVRPAYLYNEDPYTDKTVSLNGNVFQIVIPRACMCPRSSTRVNHHRHSRCYYHHYHQFYQLDLSVFIHNNITQNFKFQPCKQCSPHGRTTAT